MRRIARSPETVSRCVSSTELTSIVSWNWTSISYFNRPDRLVYGQPKAHSAKAVDLTSFRPLKFCVIRRLLMPAVFHRISTRADNKSSGIVLMPFLSVSATSLTNLNLESVAPRCNFFEELATKLLATSLLVPINKLRRHSIFLKSTSLFLHFIFIKAPHLQPIFLIIL